MTGDLYNPALYLPSTAGRINPPGAYPGTAAQWIDFVNNRWLGWDDLVATAEPSLEAPDTWGRFPLVDTAGSGAALFETLPATDIDGSLTIPALPMFTGAAGTLRYSAEFLSTGRPFGSPVANLQTFTVRISR